MKLNITLAFLLAALVNGAQDDTEPIDIGTAANYVLLAKTGVTGGANCVITGDMGVSPAAASTMTGFALAMATNGQHSTSAMVDGNVMAASYAGECAAALTKATDDVMTAYVDASTRKATATKGAALGGLTLEPGVYVYGAAVSIASDLTFDGGIDDVWIIYSAAAINVAASVDIILEGGAQAKNIFFSGATTMGIGANASIAGILLFKTTIAFGADSSLNGRAFSQTAITLGANTKLMTEEEVFC